MAKLSIEGYEEKFPYENCSDRFFDVTIRLTSGQESLTEKVRVYRNESNYYWGFTVKSVEALDEKWDYKLSETILSWCKERIK